MFLSSSCTITADASKHIPCGIMSYVLVTIAPSCIQSLIPPGNIKEISKHLKDTLNQSRNTSTTDLMFVTSTCHWPNVPCSFHACHMISKVLPKWKPLVEFWWKTQLTTKLNNKTSITLTATSQNLWRYLSSSKQGFLWRGYGSPWTIPKSIQVITELCRKNYSAIAFLVGKQVVREALAIFFPYQPDELENSVQVCRAIIFFTRTQENMLLLSLNFNLLFSWRNTVLDCLLSPRQLQLSVYDFIIYLCHKHCHR